MTCCPTTFLAYTFFLHNLRYHDLGSLVSPNLLHFKTFQIKQNYRQIEQT